MTQDSNYFSLEVLVEKEPSSSQENLQESKEPSPQERTHDSTLKNSSVAIEENSMKISRTLEQVRSCLKQEDLFLKAETEVTEKITEEVREEEGISSSSNAMMISCINKAEDETTEKEGPEWIKNNEVKIENRKLELHVNVSREDKKEKLEVDREEKSL
jgi:hypothetical protein